MLSPLLVIGIGGSGGKTIRSMKRAIERYLLAEDYKDGIPAAWQFLQIDTTYDGIDFPAPMMPENEVHTVVAPKDDFYSVLGKLEKLGSTNQEKQFLLSGWGIPKSNVTIANGAGQMRGIGRQVGIADAKNIVIALDTAINKLADATVLAELQRVSDKLGGSGVNSKPKAVLVASLAGGSGAGMFLDVAELLKRSSTDPWVSEATAFLYTSEVFDSLGEAGADVRKNSLGAMNEIIAGKWSSMTERSSILLSKLGLANFVIPSSEGDTGFGCKANILVGSTNSFGTNIAQSHDGSGMNEVFQTIGEALAGVFTDGKILEFIFQQAFVNITEKPMSEDLSGLAPDVSVNGVLPFGAMGFGRLSVGTDRVVDYVADAMTRTQVTNLLWPELNPELLKDGATLTSLIDSKANELWLQFLNDSNLSERNEKDQVLQALMPEDYMNQLKTFVLQVVNAGKSEKPIDLMTVAKKIWSEWDSNKKDFLNALYAKTNENALIWRKDIVENLSNLAATRISTNGFAVTSELLVRLKNEIVDGGIDSLLKEASESKSAVDAYSSQSFLDKLKSISEGKGGLSSADTQQFNQLVNELGTKIVYEYASFVKKLAAELLKDLVPNVLDSLIKETTSARVELDRERNDSKLKTGLPNPWKLFPDWNSKDIPPYYKPRTIERTLISPEHFKDLFTLYAKKESGNDEPYDRAVPNSLLGKRLDVMPGVVNKQDFITSTTWIPAMARLGDEFAKPSQFSIKSDISTLRTRNQEWLTDEKSPFGKITRISIKDFVNGEENPSIRKNREDQFIEAFSAMITLSQPLIKYNKSAISLVRDFNTGKQADGTLPSTSKIPFSHDSSIGVACTAILNRLGINIQSGGFAQEWFEPTSSERQMFAVSTSQASLPGWAFESLTKPIADQVAVAKNSPGSWVQFWEGRRGRPLPEAVPFSTPIRKSIVTGWFVGKLFNLIEPVELPVGNSVRIWNANLTIPNWSNFPSPLLVASEADQKNKWQLPSVLMSAGLALVELGQTGSHEPVEPYRLLKFLGREVTVYKGIDKWDSKGAGDTLPNGLQGQSSLIHNWVTSGLLVNPEIKPLKELVECESTVKARVDALANLAQKLEAEYSSFWASLEKKSWADVPQMWELKEDIRESLQAIKDYANSLEVDTNDAPSIG